MQDIKIAIIGIGNCASSLIQGLYYYKNIDNDEIAPGLMHNILASYKISDIKPVAAFDIDSRKVDKDLSEAIYSPPNNTFVFYKNVPKLEVIVKKGPVLDGFPKHMLDYEENKRFLINPEQKELDKEEVIYELRNSGAEILVNYMPVGSQKATEFYAECALEAGCGFINCMPVFICSKEEWIKKFQEKGLPCLGDDVKSQLGATIIHRVLSNLACKRGIKIKSTYQLNVGGNTDFLNMLARERLVSKKISKTESVQSQLKVPLQDDSIHIGPSDYVPSQKDQKICYLNMKGSNFGDVPLEIELKLSVEDSPNSAGCIIDAIRLVKIALDRKISGCLESASAYLMKHPCKQFTDDEARKMIEEFIQGSRER
jgi:myo-inositol-1-phosphate synthase